MSDKESCIDEARRHRRPRLYAQTVGYRRNPGLIRPVVRTAREITEQFCAQLAPSDKLDARGALRPSPSAEDQTNRGFVSQRRRDRMRVWLVLRKQNLGR